MTCKGTNCTASKENGYRHSSECLFDHARAVASGASSVSLGATLDDSIEFVEWRGQRIALSAHGLPVVGADLIADLKRCLDDVATEMRARGRDDSRFTQLSARLPALASAQPAEAVESEIGAMDALVAAFNTWPADIRKKLSLHDLRRMTGWTLRMKASDWRIDTSAGGPILTYQNCSVIEGEQARYLLRLIEADQPDHDAAQGAVEMSPEFTDSARAALAWVLYHHQGGKSAVGQAIRYALGMGTHEHMQDWRIAEAKEFASRVGWQSSDFQVTTPDTTAAELLGLDAFEDATESAYGYKLRVWSTGNLMNQRDADRFDGWQMALRTLAGKIKESGT